MRIKKSKGIALPIELLVILAIAVIILIAVVVVFLGVWNPFATSQQQQANFRQSCSVWVNSGCVKADTDSRIPDSVCTDAIGVVLDVVQRGCKDRNGKDVSNRVRTACGCPVA